MDRHRLEKLRERLATTAELPVSPSAGRWLGEAEAVAADAVAALAADEPEAAERRVRQVAELLSHVEETGHPDADERVGAARALAADLLGAE